MNKVEVTSVSYSKLHTYLTCPRRFYYTYGEGIFQEETKYSIFGTYIHSVLEDYLKHLIKIRSPQDLKGLYNIANEKKQDYIQIPETGELSFFEADIILNRFASKKIDPESVYAIEKFFRVTTGSIPNIHLEGRIDRIDIEYGPEQDNLLHIIDYKTGKNKLTEEDMADDLQVKFYILASYFLFKKRYNVFKFSMYYLRDNSSVSFRAEFKTLLENEISACIHRLSCDDKYDKTSGAHCYLCAAYKICKPDLSSIKRT
ncbi:RecB family exonuclease [Elusimicrobiota bacterium]